MRNDVPQAKHGVLTVVMVGILAVSVAMAWLTTKAKKDTSRDGAEIISKLIDDTLEGYWTGSRRDSWFIALRQDAKPIGWQKRSRGRESEGMFSGSVIDGSTGVARYESSWWLSPDLSEGRYVARGFNDKNNMVVETQITISENEVTVVRSIRGQKLAATAARPDNYVPKGTLPLVLRLVAARGREVTVKMIVDKYAIMHGAVNFVNVSLLPLGDNVVRVKCSKRGSAFTTVYHLDSNDNICQYEDPDEGIIYRPRTKEDAAKLFPILDGGPAIKAAP